MGILEASLDRLVRHGVKAGRLAALQALDWTGQAIVTDLQARLSFPGPTPSRPGEEPHKQTGKLRKSYKYKLYRRDMMVMIYTDDPKAYWLEFGTRHMAPRPHVRRGISGFFQRGRLRDYFAIAFTSSVGSV